MSTSESAGVRHVSKAWPYSSARLGNGEKETFLAAILASNALDEISTADDFAAVKEYVENQCKVDSTTGKTTVGVIFWLYPTGLFGPYHSTEDGEISQHGVLVTVEEGVLLESAVETLRGETRSLNTITHKHIHA